MDADVGLKLTLNSVSPEKVATSFLTAIVSVSDVANVEAVKRSTTEPASP